MLQNLSSLRFIVLGLAVIALSALAVVAENSLGSNIFDSIQEFLGVSTALSNAAGIAEKRFSGGGNANNPQVLSNGPIIFQRGFAAAADIPYNRGGQLYKVDPTSGIETLFGNGSQPNYSVDGSKIVFLNNAQITTSTASTYNPVGLTILGGGSNIIGLYPKWSPDGAYIAYNTTASVSGSLVYHIKIIGGSCSACDITQELNPAGTSAYIHPAWNPLIGTSGTSRTAQLIFVRTSAVKANVDAGNYTGDIFSEAITIAQNGTVTEGGRINLTNSVAKYSFPSYSHDGTKITYVKTDANGDSLIVANANGLSATTILTGSGGGQITVKNPVWSPDDTKIAYSDSIQLFQIAISNNQVTQVTTPINAAADLFPSWAPGSGSPTPTPTPTPTPLNAVLSFDGRLRDRVSKSDGGVFPDGESDGTFTVTLPVATQGKFIASVDLRGPNGNEWDTIRQAPLPSAFWVVGVARDLDAQLENQADGTLSSVPVGNTGIFKLFIGDSNPSSFLNSRSFTVTVNFTDGSVSTGSTTVNKTEADVAVAFSSSPPATISYGGTITFSLLVTNNGPEIAHGVVFNGVVDSKFDSVVVTNGIGCIVSGNSVNCNIGDVDVGTNLTVRFTARAIQAGASTNRMSVGVDGTRTFETNTTNNNVSANTTIGNPSVELIGLEVTQGVQNLNNSMPLVAGRATYVRAHVKNLSSAPVSASASLTVKDVATGTILGTIKNSNVGGKINIVPSPTPSRAILDDSFYFQLPIGTYAGQPDWTQAGTVELTFNGNEFPFTCNEVDGRTDCKTSVTFKSQRTFSIRLLVTTYTDSAGNSYTPTPADELQTLTEIASNFPIAKFGNITLDTWSIKQQYCTAGVKNATTGVVNENGIGKVLTALKNKRALDCNPDLTRTGNCRAGVEDFYLALVPVSPTICSTGFDASGLADTLLDRDGIKIDNTGNNAIMMAGFANTRAHELGHTFGLRHTCNAKDASGNYIEAGCGTVIPSDGTMSVFKDQFNANTYYGFDPFRETILGLNAGFSGGYLDHGRVYDASSSDMMSYGKTLWLSAYNYQRLFNVLLLNGGNTTEGDTRISLPQVSADKVFLIDGSASVSDGTGQIGSVYINNQSGLVTLPAPGNYSIRFDDASGSQIATYSFQPVSPGEGGDVSTFSLLLPWDVNAKRIELLRNGQVIATRQASAHPPTVTVISPNGGENLNGQTTTFSWTASDEDGDVLSYAVEYSIDAGVTWRTLAMNWPSTTYPVDLTKLAGSSQALIRVTASDGFNTTQDQSNAVFTVPSHGPAVFISTPQNNSLYVGDQTINLTGMGLDPEDGMLDGARLSWSSDLNGPLGTGRTLTINASALQEGTHTITLTATDSTAQVGSASISIRVFRVRPVLPAALAVGPSGIAFDARTALQTIAIRNSGDGDLTWSATADQPWIQLGASSGTAPSNVDVTIRPGGLPFGYLTGKITFTSPNATNSPQVVNVGLAIIQGTTSTLNGRVVTPDGRGLRNATVSITNSQGIRRSATTSSFGFFSFADVPVGDTYTIRIGSRLYRFAPRNMQIISDLTLPDFVGLE